MYEIIIIIVTVFIVENIIHHIHVYCKDYGKFIEYNVQIQLYRTINTILYTTNLRNALKKHKHKQKQKQKEK